MGVGLIVNVDFFVYRYEINDLNKRKMLRESFSF